MFSTVLLIDVGGVEIDFEREKSFSVPIRVRDRYVESTFLSILTNYTNFFGDSDQRYALYDTATIDIQIRNVNERPTFNAERLNQTIFVTGENPVGSNVGTPFKFITSDPEGGTLRFQIVCETPVIASIDLARRFHMSISIPQMYFLF